MKHTLLFVAGALLLAAITPISVQAQRRDGSLLGLLTNKGVVKEVGLLDEQIDSLKELGTELRKKNPQPKGNFRQLRGKERDAFMVKFTKWRADIAKAAQPRVAKILFPPQLKRLHEIQVQSLGTAAVLNARVAKQIKLSKEQSKKLVSIQTASSAKVRKIFADARGAGGDFAKARKLFTAAQADQVKQITAVVTKDQAKALAKLKGKPFKFPARTRGKKRRKKKAA